MVDQNWQNQFVINPYIMAPPSFLPSQRVMLTSDGAVMVCQTAEQQYTVYASTAINEKY